MAEYINREALIAEINEEIEYRTPMYTDEQNDYLEKGLRIARKDIKRFPAADVVEVVHSKWIKRNNERRCPVCGFFYLTNGMTVYNFCPMCGAKMDGDRND